MNASPPSSSVNNLIGISSLTNQYFALRHGQSKANIARIISSDPAISTVEHGLTDVGKDQVTASAIAFCQDYANEQNNGDVPVAIFSSDFTRARETASIFAELLHKNNIPLLFNNEDDKDLFGVKLETRLRERYFGQFNGQSDSHYQDVWNVDCVDADHTEFDVESVNSVVKRTSDLIIDIETKFDIAMREDVAHDRLKVILVAHGDVLQILQTAFLKKDGSVHRSLEHLETAGVRELRLQDNVN